MCKPLVILTWWIFLASLFVSAGKECLHTLPCHPCVVDLLLCVCVCERERERERERTGYVCGLGRSWGGTGHDGWCGGSEWRALAETLRFMWPQPGTHTLLCSLGHFHMIVLEERGLVCMRACVCVCVCVCVSLL